MRTHSLPLSASLTPGRNTQAFLLESLADHSGCESSQWERALSMLLAFTCFKSRHRNCSFKVLTFKHPKRNHFRNSIMNVHVGTGCLVKHNNHKEKASRCCLCLTPSLTEACWQPPLAVCFFESGHLAFAWWSLLARTASMVMCLGLRSLWFGNRMRALN